jgi:cellulose synthase/poly-beta-1,6-N-acetylglucosamine synthase-like glycosyltransferase
MSTVVIALPTTACAPYIAASLRKLVPELRDLTAAHDVTLAVCLNGPDPGGAHHAALRSALDVAGAQVPALRTHVIVREPAGKSAALGELVGYARSVGAAYILVTDDDVVFEPGTLVRSVAALVSAPTDRPVLVGARILVAPRPLRSFLARLPVHRALLAWWWQAVFRLPYEPASEFFPWAPGSCSALRVADYPELPPDDSGITDDAYVNYWMVANGGEIQQPPGSVVYFYAATDYREWIRQQLRVLAGVEATLALFADRADEIRRYFAWAYSHNKEARVRARCRTPRRLLLLAAYRLVQEDVLRHYRKLTGAPDWGRAESAKPA